MPATWRATPARKAVSPARAPEERSSPASGIFTEPEVMLTMRPNFLRRHRVDRLLDQLDRHDHVGDRRRRASAARSSSRKSRNGGPALLLTRMSGSGQAANSAFCPSGVATSATTGMIFAPVALRSLGGGRVEPRRVAPVDHHLAAGLGQRLGAGAAEPAARGADDGLAAGNTKIHGLLPRVGVAPQCAGRISAASCPVQGKDWRSGCGHARRSGGPPGHHGHFTTGGIEERIESTLPPVRSPNMVPRS